ncbi:UNVERIFIED_CONTAM: hypothetical protein GTU68_067027, partial [Idotea baltica]|nr:hypothetical protein [Idotea baltica]
HRTLALIKPDSYLHIGKIVNAIEEEGFTLGNIKMVKLTQQQAEQFYADHKGKPYFGKLVEHMISDLTVGIELIGDECVNRWRNIIGPGDPQTAQIESPKSLRALLGTDMIKNAVHGSDSHSAAARELEFFFSNKSPLKSPAYFHSCSCLIIKPHILTDGYVGQIIETVLNSGFEISAIQMFWLDRPSAEVKGHRI